MAAESMSWLDALTSEELGGAEAFFASALEAEDFYGLLPLRAAGNQDAVGGDGYDGAWGLGG